MTTITGTLANDTLIGTGDNSEIIYALDGDDIIYTGWGNGSHIYGGNGDDRIIASTNINNYPESVKSKFYGGDGSDTYVFNANSMAINILEDEITSGTDTVEFGAGITLSDLMIQGNAGSDLGIWYSNFLQDFVEGADIVIDDQALSTRVEKITFDNGETYTLSFGNSFEFPAFSGDMHNVTANNNDNEVYLAKGYYNFHAGAGNDIIHGTDDRNHAGGGYGQRDFVFGEDGDDIIYGYGGGDNLHGGNGNDILDAGTGYDSSSNLYGGNGNDLLISGDFSGGGYGSNMDGGDGDDILHIRSYSASAAGGNGSDELHVKHMIPDEHLAANSYINMFGGAGNDVYIYNRDDANDAISRKAEIRDDAGSYDTIFLDGDFNITTTANNFAITELHPTSPSSPYYMIGINDNFAGNVIERVVFSDGSIYSYGTSRVLSQIVATSGNDTIYLSAWHDEFYALGGDDTIYALERDDIVDGGSGNDTLYGEHGNDTLIGGSGNDILDGGIGNDTISYASASAAVVVKLGSNFTFDDGDGGTDTLSSIENITGSAFNDDLRGTNDVNIIHGGNGDDNIYGYFGDDELYGGAGDDFLTGAEDNDTLYGEDGADELWGGLGDDTLHGGDGDDAKLDGGSGNDTIYGDAGNDTLYGRAGNDTLNGGDGDDVFYGEDGNDIIDGGDGQDFILAGAGDDILNGGLGYDRLYGGTGADTFVFTDYSQYTSIYDRVHDFNAADGDVLDISDLISAYDPLTESIGDYVWVDQNAARSYIYIDNDGAGTNASMEYAIRMEGVFWDNSDLATLITDGTMII